jgi:signal peptidase I
LLRASVATVVQVHGDGMAPTIVDGDTVLLIRGKWSVMPGDVVVYDPHPADDPEGSSELPQPAPGAGEEDDTHPDARKSSIKQMRDVSVVDRDEFEGNWERVKEKSGVDTPVARAYRIGRVVACPGDKVTFNVDEAALGVSVNGIPLQQKSKEPIRIVLRGKPILGEDEAAVHRPRLRTSAYEWHGDVRYQVLTNTSADAAWPTLGLPSDRGPVQLTAPGYLILADNRQEGACCDSRAIGWVRPDHVRGEVVARLAGNSNATPDLDPQARGIQWLP